VKIVGAVLLSVVLAMAYGAQMARWLRVLQREHYDPSALLRFLGRWTSPPLGSAKAPSRRRVRRPFTLSHALVLALLAAVILRATALLVIVSAAYGVFCPFGLSIRGRTSPLEWTRRLRTVASLAFGLSLVVTVLFTFSRQPFDGAMIMVWAVPPVLDLSTRLLRPLEERKARKFVQLAVQRLEKIRPRIVAITGSYGKTSTKNHLAALLGSDVGVVASPRSFNNRAGLSRAINENLADATRVFIAEMGTYGPGEIRDLTSWCTPEIAVITAIGPVHLERMRTLDVVEAAKHEITERASVVVVNIDDERLAKWPAPLKSAGKRVITAGSLNDEAAVRVVVEGDRWTLLVEGATLGSFNAIVGVQPTNLACAMAAATSLGVPSDELVQRASRVTPVANRSNVVMAASGVVVIDDTFNANPASAAAAMKLLTSLDVTGRRVVVTPGLIELGIDQYPENFRLARSIDTADAQLVVVARTNVVALQIGYDRPVKRFDQRDDAVKWVRSSLRGGDAVLYLNDLPDHYP
jgi:UDP-N-acetylmuramoyl-tripeptide--D-alanyl-D-alanine ligase